MTAPIAAELGRLAGAARGVPDEEVRFALFDAIIAAKAAGAMPQETWEDAFGAAVRSLRVRVLGDAEQEIRAAARTVRYPRRSLARALPDADAAEALLQRMLAAGIALERLAPLPDDGPSRRARASALDHGWAEAMLVSQRERARWRITAQQVAAWRRSPLPLWCLSVAIVAMAVVAAAWLSGEVAAPHWFAPVNDAWWRLWP